MRELLAQSLVAWRVAGSVERAGDGALVIAGNRKDIRIEPAPPDLMFRWMVTVDGRRRGAISLVAVLRQVREALDPGYAANRVRVAVAPLVPSMSRGRRSRFRCSPGSSAAARPRCSRHLLRQPEFSRTAVIINEFGEIGLDHELIEASEDSFIELHDRLPVLQGPHRPGADPAGHAAAARRGPLHAVRPHRDRNQRAGRSGADPANADDRRGHCRPAGARRRRDDGRCRERRRHARARSDFAKAGRRRRPDRPDKAGSGRSLPQPRCSAVLQELNAGAPVLAADHGRIDSQLVFDAGLYDPPTKSARRPFVAGGSSPRALARSPRCRHQDLCDRARRSRSGR